MEKRGRRGRPQDRGVEKGKEIVSVRDRLAAEAKAAAETEARANTGGMKFFSIRGGILMFDDNKMPRNEMAVVILDHMFENIYYGEDYDPEVVTPPVCYAFAREQADLAPHEDVVAREQAVNETCKGCPMNEFGSATRGKGKACSNRRRLAMVPAGTFNKAGDFDLIEDDDHYLSTEVGALKLPVTSVKGYSTYVKQLAATEGLPPWGVVTRVWVEPDPKSQFKVHFELQEVLPDDLMEAVMSRRDQVMMEIDAPYNLDHEEREVAEKPRTRSKRAARKY